MQRHGQRHRLLLAPLCLLRAACRRHRWSEARADAHTEGVHCARRRRPILRTLRALRILRILRTIRVLLRCRRALLLLQLLLRLQLLRLLLQLLRRRRALGNRCPHVTPLPQLAEVRLPSLGARAAASRQVEPPLGGHTLAQPAPVRVAVLQRAG